MNVKLETDGGFTGRGIGSLIIEERKVIASNGRATREGTLSDREEDLLRAAIPEPWPESIGKGWPDQIRYSLTIGERAVSWYGEDVRKELRRISEVLWTIRDRVLRE